MIENIEQKIENISSKQEQQRLALTLDDEELLLTQYLWLKKEIEQNPLKKRVKSEIMCFHFPDLAAQKAETDIFPLLPIGYYYYILTLDFFYNRFQIIANKIKTKGVKKCS